MKTSIPKLHRFTPKHNGINARNVEIHQNAYDYIDVLQDKIQDVIDQYGYNMSRAEIVGVLEYLKRDLMG